jgi:hypothetical protein
VQSLDGTICWLDPGATTGIAAYTFRAGGSFHSWQLQFSETGRRIEELAGDWGPLHLGYESFTITPGSHVRHDGSALMSIGMARWLAFKHGIAMLPSQPPSARRLGLKHLKTVGWYRPGLGHANDAAAHLLTYFLAKNLLPEELKERLRGNSGDL